MEPRAHAKSGDLTIAYQVVGEGPHDLVFVAGAITNLELSWEERLYATEPGAGSNAAESIPK